MPKVLEDLQKNLFVYIYTTDHTPAHVHVFKGRKTNSNTDDMKINIGNQEQEPYLVDADPNLSNKDIKNAIELVTRNKDKLLEKWQEIHGTSE